MNDALQARMAEATRLTRQGRLAEATALIQESFGTGADPAVEVPRRHPDDTREPIEGSARLVEAAPPAGPATAPHTPRPARAATAPAPGTGAAPGIPRRPTGSSVFSGLPGTLRPHPRATGPTPAVTGGEGRFLEASYSSAAGTRTYRLYIPRGYTGQAVPLLIMLHGCTQSPEDFAAGTQMNVLADTHTFLVAYPAQAAAANPSRCWNWFETVHQARAQGEPAIIAGLTQQVMTTYNVDARRVSVAGLSAGGAMAAVLGVTYPDLYAAVGVHSGLAYGAAGDLGSAMAAMQQGGTGPLLPGAQRAAAPGVVPRVVPLILFHGEQDTTVSPRNADQLRTQWLTAHGAGEPVPATTEQGTGGHRATRTVYRDGRGQTLVEQWRIQGLGHAWSGGSPAGSYTDAQGPDASAEMVRFFREHLRI
jgi:poly(hydroxyalkanoate) depolymerase family esterase